jgi:hypothetical protein
MISMLVLALMALGMVRLTFQMRVTAEDNIHHSAAYVMAQGYLEELSKLCYANLAQVANPTPPPAFIWKTNPTMNKLSPPGVWDIASDATNTVNIYLKDNQGNDLIAHNNTASAVQTVYLDQDGNGNASFPMQFQFTPILKCIDKPGGFNSTTAQGVEITIQFTFTYSLNGSPNPTHTVTSSVSTVYPNLPQ